MNSRYNAEKIMLVTLLSSSISYNFGETLISTSVLDIVEQAITPP